MSLVKEFDGKVWPHAAVPVQCDQCQQWCISRSDNEKFAAIIAGIPVDELPDEARLCGREVICEPCLDDVKNVDGSRLENHWEMGRHRKESDHKGDQRMEENGSSWDNQVRGMEEAISEIF